MFTRRLKQLVGNAAADIGSQPVHSEVSPGKPVGKKHVGKAVSEVVAVPVPFGSLPGDFGVQPLQAKAVAKATGAEAAEKTTVMTGAEAAGKATVMTDAEAPGKVTVMTDAEVSAAKETGGDAAGKATVTTDAEAAGKATVKAASKKRIHVDEDATRKKAKGAGKKVEVEVISETKGKGTKKNTVVEAALDEADMKKPGRKLKSKAKGRGKKPVMAKAAEDSVAVVDEEAEQRKDVLLRYPFIFGGEIETATNSLKLCHNYNSWVDEAYNKMSDDDVIKLQQEASNARKKKGRNH